MIEYRDTADGISIGQLEGFFVGWPNPPSPVTHLRILQSSFAVELAFDAEQQRVVGFVTAISDGLLSAYLPLLEVLPEYQNQRIGSELVRRILARLSHLYMVDVICDPEIEGFYASFNLQRRSGMVLRNYQQQTGLC